MSRDLSVPAPPLVAAAGLSRVLVQRTSMAMLEPAYSYTLYVAEDEAPGHARAICTHFSILPEHGFRDRFIEFATATCPAAHSAMPTGWARYQDWLEHERMARREALVLACAAFPELRMHGLDTLPSLWIVMPEFPGGTHSEVWLTFAP